MSPVSRGTQGFLPILLLGALVLLQAGRGAEAANAPPAEAGPSPKPLKPKTPNDIEEFVKKLEYEAQGGVDNSLDGIVDVVDFNLLSDVVADTVQDGLEEEFTVVDSKLGENATVPVNKIRRQLSLIYQGVYAPDARFNAFADGVMVNMVAEMKRKRMDPLYFRVYDRGIVEHVSTQSTRGGRRDEPSAVSSSFADASSDTDPSNSNNRRGRQSGNAIGGGVIRGLTNVRRFGNAEVQVAGNTTLIRSHYVYGPLNIELVFNTDKGVKTINSTLGAVAAHAVTGLHDNSSKLIDFIIDSPAEYEIRLTGARSRPYQRISHSAIMRILKPTGKLERRMKQSFIRARSRRIPDVTNRRRNGARRNNNRRGSRKNRKEGQEGPDSEIIQDANIDNSDVSNSTTEAVPELP
ncbi:uncharacterized protein LOC122264311 [Penaeus japonicus]|uniref:uncharacterized protein LOC122264311 n=1 Tax=Penaeus japonicus TaxID=27405 RepID=UPI001C710193|nr:uncharacterized protein LOC122264311 [Penaeus japonicus]